MKKDKRGQNTLEGCRESDHSLFWPNTHPPVQDLTRVTTSMHKEGGKGTWAGGALSSSLFQNSEDDKLSKGTCIP